MTMKFKYIAALLILIAAFPLSAQLKTFINIESGPSWNMVKVADPGNYFSSASLSGTFNGFTIEQEIIENLSIGAGIYIQSFRDGIKMIDDRVGTPGWAGYSSLQVPIRIKYRIQLSEFPISLTPRLGYVMGFLTFPQNPYNGSSILSAPDGSAFSYTVSQSHGDDKLHLLETGLSLGFRFPGYWQVGLNLTYSKGFTEPLRSELSYVDQNNSSRSATYYSYGENFRTTINLLVPLSNTWQNRDQRLRSKIERAYGGGKQVKKGTEIYFGGEIGALWRLFQYSNPAIAPLPMDNRGIFKFANLKTGLYAGIMLNSYLGLDIGAYYQKSGTSFAVMYDHEVDYLNKANAPMYIEIPVKLRYFYSIIRSKLDLAIYAGGSLLTHFASADYDTGTGTFTYLSPQTGTETGTLTYTASRTSRFGGALKAGLGFEYRLPTFFPFIATLYADYTHGYIKIDEIVVESSIQEIPSENFIFYSGNGWGLSLGIKVPFVLDPKGTSKCGRLPRTR